ncbi:MAG: hypothetical protein MRY83_22670, partial [Flavobacteriales bacterium]|nr:hypothetical protein [Flavobacteriales bacterium]
VDIPERISSYGKDITIALFISKKGGMFILKIEKFYSLERSNNLVEKSREFGDSGDLMLYLSNNYSLTEKDFQIV